MRGNGLAILIGVVLVNSAAAQTVARFAWKQGQILTYRVDQSTSASDVVEEKTTETGSKMTTVKRWQVLGVDQTGVATLQLSVISLHFEVKTPKGETLMFDSTQPDKSDPQLREQMAKYVGPPLAVLHMDASGRVVEVKESKQAPASRLDQLPLLEMQPDGEIVFDAVSGRLHRARLTIDKELKGLEGEGSSYHFQST